ncbi:MAG: HAD-IC family P-type ATPase [Rhodocyclaceae bacterium]|nr:HAD-IC family P-type ATPase [Rhodocyclaceae bacterium]
MDERQTLAWHALRSEEVAAKLASNAVTGLSEEEAKERLVRYGANRLPQAPAKSAMKRLWEQLSAPLVLVLIVAGVITAFLGEWVDAGVILGVVAINATIGMIQEGKAAEALAALARTLASEVTVIRAGKRRRIDATELVPGDLVQISAGDKTPADLRLVFVKELRTSEAALTGESLPIEKSEAPLASETALPDRRNMAYAGTIVVAGQALGLVVATGRQTETGRIAELIAQAPEMETPLTRKIAAFARLLLWAILALAAATFAIGVARAEPIFEMFMAAVALAVGAIPEGLPAAVTITLAIGVARMAKRRAIIRQLPAVEALGSTTVICSDKTGTLTENEMTVRALWTQGLVYEITGHGYVPTGEIRLAGQRSEITEAVRECLLAGLLCNDATLTHVGGEWRITGDPTEAALIVAAKKAGLDETTVAQLFPRLDVLPFESARQMMATLHRIEGETVIYVKGALEKILPACEGLTPQSLAEIELAAREMAREGLRVLAFARRISTTPSLAWRDVETGLSFLGLMGMIDPPRPRAIAAVKACHTAGIRVKMITGDHRDTALAIAKQLGIAQEGAAALTGQELARMSEQALIERVQDVDVFARIEPEQKLRLVKALQAHGEIVAMTGDGVNDAPALKAADIGIAMGKNGTEVAKEAAAMVLTDDNFASIEAAIEEGRGIYDNLLKFITWTLPTNFGEGVVILAAIVMGVALPITPLQILWINMTTAILLGLPLAFEPKEADVMHRPPRPPQAPILDAVLVQRILLLGTLMLIGAFGLFLHARSEGASIEQARTLAVNVFVAMEMAFLFNCRSLTKPLWRLPPFGNPWVWGGALSMLGLQLLFTYLPIFQRIFGTAPLSLGQWGLVALGALAALVIMEIEKALRGGKRTSWPHPASGR